MVYLEVHKSPRYIELVTPCELSAYANRRRFSDQDLIDVSCRGTPYRNTAMHWRFYLSFGFDLYRPVGITDSILLESCYGLNPPDLINNTIVKMI